MSIELFETLALLFAIISLIALPIHRYTRGGVTKYKKGVKTSKPTTGWSFMFTALLAYGLPTFIFFAWWWNFLFVADHAEPYADAISPVWQPLPIGAVLYIIIFMVIFKRTKDVRVGKWWDEQIEKQKEADKRRYPEAYPEKPKPDSTTENIPPVPLTREEKWRDLYKLINDEEDARVRAEIEKAKLAEAKRANPGGGRHAARS